MKDGKIGGELAEDLMTAAQCELGARPAEEQAALVDGILERANGDEALARRMLEKLTTDVASGGPEPLPKDGKALSERLDRLAEESKVEAIKERNGAADGTARGASVEPVETEDGQIKTVGDVVDADTSIAKKANANRQREVRRNLAEAIGGIVGNTGYGILRRGNTEIRFELGKSGKKGMGAMHIVESRMQKDGLSLDEAAEIAVKVGEAAVLGEETLRRYNTIHYDYNGVRAIVAEMPDGSKVITGYEIKADAESGANRRPDSLRTSPHVSSEEVVAALKRAAQRLEAIEPPVVDIIANSAATVNAEPKPTTALGGAEQAERLAGTKLTVFNGTTMGCETFPEAKVNVSADGVTVRGLAADTMAKPENVADVAAFMTHLMRIAKRNGIRIEFEDADAAKIAQALVAEISEKGAAKTMAKLETRGKLFGLLFRTTLGNGVTYDEASFKEALKGVGNGRQFVDNHGDVYGFVDGEGVLHFNPATFRMDTPIHEYGHLALEATKKINNALWKKGNALIKESGYYRDLLSEIEQDPGSPYRDFGEEGLCDEALARLIGDRGAKLVEEKGLDAQLKGWLKEVWKAFKGALGIADLTEEQIERMTVGDFVDTINAELLKGGEFGTKKRTPPSKKSIKRFDEDQGSGSNGLLRWKNDRGYLFAIPVDMERTQPGGRVEFATDDANITDWIQSALHGYELRLSKSGKLYVKGRDGLPDELAEIFGRYPTMGQNDGIYEEFADESGGARYETPEALVEALRRDRANYDAWTQGRDAEAEHWAMEEARENAEAAARWEQSGMSVMDYIRSRVEEGDPEFDLDWETAREIERDRAMGRFQAGNRAMDGAAQKTKPKLDSDLSQKANAIAFKNFVKGIEAAPMPERLTDSSPKNVFAWFEENMVGKTYSFDIPGYGHREFTPAPGHIGKLVCSGGTLADGSKIVKGRIKKSTKGKDWKQMVRDGEISSSDVEGWDPARAKSLPLVPKVLDGFDFVLHEKDPSGRDILIFAKKFKNKKGRPNTIVMRVIDDGKTIGPISTHVRDLTDTWLKNKDLVTTSGNEVYDRGEDNSASRSPTPTDNAERNSVGTGDSIAKQNDAGNGMAKMSVGRLYTGSAADYEKPSLLKVGTGEGSQVYGWGLYASSERGVAEGYAKRSEGISRAVPTVIINGKEIRPSDVANEAEKLAIGELVKKSAKLDKRITREDVEDTIRKLRSYAKYNDGDFTRENDAAKFLEDNIGNISVGRPNYVYEQTFFTNRAPGDESHLLKWYEPVSEKIRKLVDDKIKSDGKTPLFWKTINTGNELYNAIIGLTGSPEAASKYLAAAEIDGIKYPADSYGGKRIKDGNESGWNYVSFRDDNIRVDHKWRDGQALFSVGPNTKNEKEYSYDALIQKPNVKAPTVRKAFNEKSNLSQMILEAKRSVISAGGKNTDRGLALNIPAFGDVIVVGKRGIQHGLRPYGLYGDVYEKNNADVLTVLGDVLKGSVPVNELNPDGTENKSIVGSTILLGACKTERGITPVISVVNHAKDTNVTPEVYVYPLKSINAQERSPDAFDTHSGTTAQDEISIANLIAIAQPLHPQIFSRDVANALGVSYRGSEINAKYSAGDRAMDGAARNGMGGAAQDLAFDPSMIVYNPKLKAMGETEQNAGGLAAAIEKKEALRPWTRKDSPCDLAKPIAMDMADMVQFIRAINGAARTPIIRKGEHIPGRPNAIGLNRGVLGVDLCYNTETRGGENE